MNDVPSTRHHDRGALLVLAAVLAAMAATQMNAYLNHDVAWFSWAALQMLGGAQLGRDIFEPNFPMAYLIYFPAAVLHWAMGLSAAVKFWVLLLTGLSLVLSLERLPERTKIPFLLMVGLFLTLAMPREWGQREYFALILVLPYCIPHRQTGWRAYLVGSMAGIGFCIKPYFLIAWLLVEIGQKPFRAEQRALLVTMFAYLAVIAIFFRPFVSTMLALTPAVYDSFNRPLDLGPFLVAIGLLVTTTAFVVHFKDKNALSLALASIGFAIAAIAQQRFYTYQMLPSWGLLCAATAVLAMRHQRFGPVLVTLVVVTLAIKFAPESRDWFTDRPGRNRAVATLARYLDNHETFAVFSVHPFPAFPTALYTRARYTGVSNSEWFLPAVAQSDGRNAIASNMAVKQAVLELSRNPDIVIVSTDWRRHTQTPPDWDGLAFLKSDKVFADKWEAYHRQGNVIGYEIYAMDSAPVQMRGR